MTFEELGRLTDAACCVQWSKRKRVHSREGQHWDRITRHKDTLTPEHLRMQEWRGVRQTVISREAAADYLAWWGSATPFMSENITRSIQFQWGRYVMGMSQSAAVVGSAGGIVKFYVVEIPGVSDPSNSGNCLLAFIAWRSDGSQVRIHPRTNQPALLLYVDRPGPDYQGHLARRTPWPPGYWRTPLTEAECRLCPRLGAEIYGLINYGVIATADGFDDLHDIVTNIEAEAALQSFDFSRDHELDLSQGDLFPWVLWVHHQAAIMAEIRQNRGITKFAAIMFGFDAREGSHVKARAFQIVFYGGHSLSLVLARGVLTIAPMTTAELQNTIRYHKMLGDLVAQRG